MANGAEAIDEACDEITPIVLGASFLTGLSVTVKHSTDFSECAIAQPTSHWPRERAMGVFAQPLEKVKVLSTAG